MQTTRQRIIYIVTDLVSAIAAWFVFNVVRYFTLPYNYPMMSIENYLSMRTVIIGQCLFPLMIVAIIAISGYYNNVFFKSRLSDVLNSAAVAAVSAFIIFFTVLFNDKIDDRLGNVEMVAILWLLFTLFLSIPRLAVTSLAARRIRNRRIVFRAYVFGPDSKAKALAAALDTKYRGMGFVPVGEPSAADVYIVVPEDGNVQDTIALINRLLPTGKPVYLTPDAYHVLAMRPRTSVVAGEVLIDISRADIPPFTANLKRIGDVAVSAVMLAALSPALLLLGLMVRLDSAGPAFYSQERVGYKKKPFRIYKLRTMRVGAEESGPSLASATDPRITRMGRVLRKYRLDELPQFWNVFKGDMSLVGPRPERDYYLRQIISRAPYYNIIHQVRPGITSWGMVKYGYASNVDEMLERMKYDLLYVDNVSFSVDAKILFYTVNTVITGRGV